MLASVLYKAREYASKRTSPLMEALRARSTDCIPSTSGVGPFREELDEDAHDTLAPARTRRCAYPDDVAGAGARPWVCRVNGVLHRTLRDDAAPYDMGRGAVSTNGSASAGRSRRAAAVLPPRSRYCGRRLYRPPPARA